MSHTVSQDYRTISHPLAGLEAWPRTGPVYGFAEEENAPRASTLWERIGERFRKPPSRENFDAGQARIWY